LRGWEKYQHYKDRDPPWVKLYRDLLTSESWVEGTDISRLVQVASILLAARYTNKIPLRWSLIRKVANLDFNEKQFTDAVNHLAVTNFLEIQEIEVPASATLATCAKQNETLYSETEQSRAETEGASAPQKRRKKSPEIPLPDDFSVDAALADYSTAHLPDVDVKALEETFRLTAKKKQWAYADWRLAFQGYVRNAMPGSGHFAENQYPKQKANGGGWM
jgi:hypothetical protein